MAALVLQSHPSMAFGDSGIRMKQKSIIFIVFNSDLFCRNTPDDKSDVPITIDDLIELQ
jgi:hypothetical protein